MNYPRRTVLRLMLYAGVSLPLAGCMKHAPSASDEADYYTCTMHPSVRSHDPHGRCPICGMELVPVMKRGGAAMQQAAAGADAHEFVVPVERQQQIGVTFATVMRRSLHASLRAAGTVEADASRQWVFAARTGGYVEKLFVTSPGQEVERGQSLLSIYSPDLLTTERELLMLLRTRDEGKPAGSGDVPQSLIEAAEARLAQWNVTPEQVAALEKERQPNDHLILRSPFRGIVQDVPVHQGDNVKAGDRLVAVADLSQVWVWAEFYEDELGALQPGQKVAVTSNAFPARGFDGILSVIDPFVDEATRTTKVRIDVANADRALRPGMYVNVELGRDGGEALGVPAGAIMPTGSRNIAFVDRGNGKLAPRSVRLGGKFGDYYKVIEGLKEGERVVTSANFLIDAESKVQGALQDFDGTDAAGGKP